jgi:hypothetical protein
MTAAASKSFTAVLSLQTAQLRRDIDGFNSLLFAIQACKPAMMIKS